MGSPQCLSFLLLLFVLNLISPSFSSRNNFLYLLPETNIDRTYCDSWRFSVETNDAGAWKVVPHRCAPYVAEYMTGRRYLSDSLEVARDALAYAQTVDLAGDGKDAWVFDLDETLLSNLPYYAGHEYGAEPYNDGLFDVWVNTAKAPALPASLLLYNGLKQLGFKLVLLTGRSEMHRAITEKNLRASGYKNWEKLILRAPSESGKTAVVYKSGKRAELVADGYRIHGSSGDQWSDLMGSPQAARSFKLPNPMYYIP